MNNTTIIFTHGGGRLGNQMLNCAALYSLYKHHKGKINILNLNFTKYMDLFKFNNSYFGDEIFCRKAKEYSRYYLKLRDKAQRLIKFLLHLYGWICPGAESIITRKDVSVHIYTLGKDIGPARSFENSIDKCIKNKQRIVWAGWDFHDWDLLEKYADNIRQQFRFKDIYYAPAMNIIDKARQGCDILAGVLIRQTDYRYWRAGQYFFDTGQYVNFMQQFCKRFFDKKVKFLIASDEKQDLNKFKNIDYVLGSGQVTGPGHYLENMIALSACDYVMSPLSTFSQWASFLGKNKFILLYSSLQDIATSQGLTEGVFRLNADLYKKYYG